MWRLVAIGVFVHFLLLSAVFDIYFVSPIQHGMTTHKPKGPPLAKRVVLIVADGLRAESIYSPTMPLLAPFLNSTIAKEGSWGVSHTQVPTESRPGHIAILAGFNEDPSAITRGWKYNPVEFDSVINQSTNAWCWGSPDIVDIFNRDNLPHIHLNSYDAYMQDFSGKHVPMQLDAWVFSEVFEFFDVQRRKPCTDVCESGNVFFLHLLGIDTAGHSYKPGSNTYFETIKFVDEGTKRIVRTFEDFFQDNQTAYIFTSDHGMTNWGSHGDGSTHETDVPFIIWGSGIANKSTPIDLEQQNIASLISSLIGINIPINSLGVVPLEYLNATHQQIANIIEANVLQLSEQFTMKHLNLKANTMSWFFRPFPKLTPDSLLEKLQVIHLLGDNEFYGIMTHDGLKAINLFKEGLKYYNSYYQNLLLFFVTTGFIGWIIYLFISIKDLNTEAYNGCVTHINRRYRTMRNIPARIIGLILLICLIPFAPSVPIKYYIYCLFPIFTWCMVLSKYKDGLVSIHLLLTFNLKDFIFTMLVYCYEIELLIFTFFRHVYLTLLFFNLSYQESKKNSFFSVWVCGLFILGLSPLLTYIQTEFGTFNQIAALILWGMYGSYVMSKLIPSQDKFVFGVQFMLLFAAFCNTLFVEMCERNEYGISFYNQLISWILLGSAFVYPFFMSTKLYHRVLSCIIALMTPYTLMAVGHESIFMFFFAHQMLNWIVTEHNNKATKNPGIPILKLYDTMTTPTSPYTNKHTVKLCFYLLAFIMLTFFGTGNSASINSFDPMWTRCFITVFSPYTMATLILIKLTIPFLIATCAFRGVMIVNEAQIRNSFLIILLFCDLMVIHFLYMVKNEGSWLEIGTSLSRFVIVNVTTIVLLLLYQVASFLTTKKLTVAGLRQLFGLCTHHNQNI